MPIGKVKWYDPERGFGFISNPGDEDCFVSKSVLPDGVTELHRGQRVDFDFASGTKGPQALRIKLVDEPRARTRRIEHKYTPEELGSLIADMVTTLEERVQPPLTAGRYPDRKEGKKIAEALRIIARELDA
ncbi:MAG: cold-shock protein [Corynebacterium sp.]|nr:cold-shock protein [Corynebacterium sp.]